MAAESTTVNPDTLRVGICSWNVGNTAPPADLSAWLGIDHNLDILAIGTQECRFKSPDEGSQTSFAELPAVGQTSFTTLPGLGGGSGSPSPLPTTPSQTNLATSHSSRPMRKIETLRGLIFWDAVESSMPAGEFQLVGHARRMEMHLHVYVRSGLVPHIGRVKVSDEATGLANIVGNKGGVAVSLDFYPNAADKGEKKKKNRKHRYRATKLAFVSSHLAAHQAHVEKRNQDYFSICSGIDLGQRKWGLTTGFDHIFWFGDLNYRVEMSFADCFPLAEQGTVEAIQEMYKHDQLQHVLDNKQAFLGFTAPVPSFPPTYRMKKGVAPATYDPGLERIPSWCDRVLTKSAPAQTLNLLEFVSCPSITTSDHTPIRAVYDLKLYRPLPRPATGPVHIARALVISNMRGSDLRPADPNGLSDPYLAFSSPGVLKTKSVHTKIEKKTLNPNWGSEEIRIKFISGIVVEELATLLLNVRVMDKDVLTRDDRLGEFRIPITPGEVTVPVDYDGVLHGTITLTLAVESATE